MHTDFLNGIHVYFRDQWQCLPSEYTVGLSGKLAHEPHRIANHRGPVFTGLPTAGLEIGLAEYY